MNQANKIASIWGLTSKRSSKISNTLSSRGITVFPAGWTLGLSVIFSLGMGILGPAAQAASLTLNSFEFTEVAGDFTITGGETTADAFRVFQDVTGPDIDLFMSIGGLKESGFIGFQFESVLTNRTNTPWIFFDHELQEKLGTPSPEEDGLSFAQNITTYRPFTSTAFSVVDEVTDVRDFVNFSEGVVNPNETVSFRYVILDNDPNELFFLRQRPNFAPGGVGAVEPVEPVPSEPVIVASLQPLPTVVASPTVIEPVSEPVAQASVPEPTISLGMFGLMGVAGLLQYKR